MVADERLTRWLVEFSVDLLRLELYEGAGEFELDYSGRSLFRLGEIAVEDAAASTGPAASGLARAVAGYAGEVLLRLAGGGWRWAGDEPVVQADGVLGLSPVPPLRLVGRAVSTGDEAIFATVYAAWREAVERHRRAHPAWMPVKEYTPGIDPVPMAKDERARLQVWLAERDRAFAGWAADHAGDGPWDFSPESLDRLERLVRRRTPSVEAVGEPTNAGFIDGAVWYFGEALRRIRGGRWGYGKVYPGDSPDAYQPSVDQTGRDDLFAVPFYAIQGLVLGGEHGTLRAKYDEWAH